MNTSQNIIIINKNNSQKSKSDFSLFLCFVFFLNSIVNVQTAKYAYVIVIFKHCSCNHFLGTLFSESGSNGLRKQSYIHMQDLS